MEFTLMLWIGAGLRTAMGSVVGTGPFAICDRAWQKRAVLHIPAADTLKVPQLNSLHRDWT